MKINQQAISLISLVITVIVIAILAGVIILAIGNSGVLDNATKAKFMNDFRSVEEGVSLFSATNLISDPSIIQFPLEGKLTLADKKTISDEVPTLRSKIEELSGGKSIDNIDLYWISEPQIDIKLSQEKQEKGYIMDVTTGQIYDYLGDVFEKKRWHTLDSGVDESIAKANGQEVQEVWDGWIRLTLYYPKGVTDKKWRLGSAGELRVDPMLMWQNYSGPITISLYRTQDVWISYKLNGKEVIVPPAGKLLVDIVPDKTGEEKVPKVNVTINYDEESTIKEYRINDSGWITYTGQFTVTENCIVEARAKKTENIYNTDGSLKTSRDIVGSDMVYIGNIGIEESEIPTNALPAPIIERLTPQSSDEKARVKITYPTGSVKNIYTVNFGVEENYSSEISIKEWGTTIVAYYYDADGTKSRVSKIYINNTTDGVAPQVAKSDDVKIPQIVPSPTITRLAAQDSDEKAKVKIDYPANAVKKIYKINYGEEQEYNDEISIKNWGTNVIAYYYDGNGNMSQIESITINDTSSGQPPQEPKPYSPLPPYEPEVPSPPTEVDTNIDLPAPTITRLLPQDTNEKAKVNIVYPSASVRNVYTVNNGAEIAYNEDIKINGWGTKITAYYYDAKGNKSRQAQITINEEPTAPVEKPVFKPESVVEEPVISISPNTEIVKEVKVTVTTPVAADKIYLKLGKYAQYKEYTEPVTVTENMQVYAYYKAATGETSVTANETISNIKEGTKPYLNIGAKPYPWPGAKGAQDVTVTLNYSDATKIEYSEDGIVYQLYTSPFKVTKNERVYARATNTYGITESYLDITNIGTGESGAQPDADKGDKPINPTVPEPLKILGVSINSNPDSSIIPGKVAKVTISIEYDVSATEKLYSIGKYGDVKTYTGPFDVTSNCTIYAYAKGANALGQATKVIDNLLNGISDPIISTNPSAGTTASKVMVNIVYDKYATVKKYSIAGGTLQDYTGDFEVKDNGTKIYAYSENAAVQNSQAYYTIQNIVPELPVVLLDKGSYYILKLSYPDGSKDREYKWKEDGAWIAYKEAGILLIKSQYKDQVLKNGTLIKIEDENGNKVDFKGDYYVIDVAISELLENLFMRWDKTIAKAPTISIDPTTVTKSVTANITYEDDLLNKKYRILKPGGAIGDWLDYTGPIIIDANNTVIYAKGIDETETWSQEGIFKVTNIDELSPVINLTADLSTLKRHVPITVNVTDNFEVSKIKWAPGILGESYFKTLGTGVVNNSIVDITENGYYTFYAEDSVGNTQLYTLNVANIDKTAPQNPIIIATPIDKFVGTVTVTITYDTDVAIKEYSTNGTTWQTYTGPLAITTNNTTIYARAKDSAGNQSGQSTSTITNIDKIAPTVAFGTNGGSGGTVSSLVTVSDGGGSYINLDTLQYVWDTQNASTPSSGWIAFTNGDALTKGGVDGTYYLWIKASDNAGNSVAIKTNAFILSQPEALNKPVLATGMTAKKWNGSSWVTVTSPDTDTSWYSYKNKQWANAQTADGSMWVWIPRYEYKIPTPHSSSAQTISVIFSIDTPTTPTSGYIMHPAFTFGSTELTGIWIAKFKASGSTTALAVKPGATSIANITIATAFTACRNMETTYGARYGWGTTGTGIDTHLIKNTEWAAAAYLSKSVYGKNSEIWKNPNSNYLTGQSGTSVSSPSTSSTYPYNNATYGVNASTTGNISGVYDMSGGVQEFTAAYVNNGRVELTNYGSSLVSAASKYKDVYTSSGDTQSGNYSANAGRKGDAVYEISASYSGQTSWYSDYSQMPYMNGPFFGRCSSYMDTSGAGAFVFVPTIGQASIYYGFRPALAISSGL